MKRYFSIGLVLLLSALPFPLRAQSESFRIGKALELQSSVLRSLQQNYVDSLALDSLVFRGLNAMLAGLDPYTVFLPEDQEENIEMLTTGNYGGVGSVIQKLPEGGIRITEPYAGSPSDKAGLQPGDVILEIDGTDTRELTVSESSSRMRGVPGTPLKLKVCKVRTGDTVDVTLTREIVHRSGVIYSGMLRDSIGYVQLADFTLNGSKEVRAALENLSATGNLKRVVLDLRGNGGGLLPEAVKIVSLFVPKGTQVVYTQGRIPESRRDVLTNEEPWNRDIPVMVLINSASASSSEIVAGALQDLDRAVIAGTRSYGKGLVQSIQGVGYNASLKLTVAKYYTPSGRCVQAIDYASRNEDGSVGSIPDSLRRAFRTASGRTVYDGGGITPDLTIEPVYYTRPLVSLIYSGILQDYAIRYYSEHDRIAPAAEFRLTDGEYARFVDYAAGQEFDVRSDARIELDQLMETARREGLYDENKALFESLREGLERDRRGWLTERKDQVKPLLEQEIASKYYFERGGAARGLVDDAQIYRALDGWDSVSLLPDPAAAGTASESEKAVE